MLISKNLRTKLTATVTYDLAAMGTQSGGSLKRSPEYTQFKKLMTWGQIGGLKFSGKKVKGDVLDASQGVT